ncbi:DUF4429 domain-containing protein [Streptomyces sp. NPDC056682]|uniref:DUF4429 domain-containing protein n=1 Tax=Streptomyces sp. NPDC056682 TaxID=3345909 RepID=UPI0036CB8D35
MTLHPDSLELRFSVGRLGDPLKAALRIRRFPLSAVTGVRYEPPTGRRRGSLQLLIVPGSDPLRPLLKEPDPGPGTDPDTLVIPLGRAVEAAAFAGVIRARLAEGLPVAGAHGTPRVESGDLPMEVSGTDGRVSFDGETVVLQFGRLASQEKRHTARRAIPLDAIADVRVHHPGLTGWLHFALAGAPVAQPITPKTDVNTLLLNADRSQAYAILGAAVLTRAHRAGAHIQAEPLPTPDPPVASRDEQQPACLISAPRQAVRSVPTWAEPASANTDPEPGPPLAAVSDRSPSPTRKERRDARRATKEYQKELASWEEDQQLLDEIVAAACRAGAASAGTACTASTPALIILKANETALWTGQASLIEPRRRPGHYAGGSSGVRVKVAKGVSFRVGVSNRQYVPGPEVQTPIDRGQAIVTTQRVVFKGTHNNKEWAFVKLLSVENAAGGQSVLLPVSNRQKISGLLLGQLAEEFSAFLTLGLAIWEHGPRMVITECEKSARAHREQRPLQP